MNQMGDDHGDVVRQVGAACEIWKKRLIDNSRNNSLLFFRKLKVGTFELTKAPLAIEKLLNRNPLSIKDLLPAADMPAQKQLSIYEPLEREQVDKEARKLVQHILLTIQRKAVLNLEEKGIETLFLAFGMATWPADDEGRPYEAPVLLVPAQIKSRGRLGEDMRLEITGEPHLNIVLLYVLEQYYGLDLNAEEILATSTREDDEGNWFILPSNAYELLKSQASHIDGFSIQDRVVLGNFQFAKMAMVEDLKRHLDQMTSHPIITAVVLPLTNSGGLTLTVNGVVD